MKRYKKVKKKGTCQKSHPTYFDLLTTILLPLPIDILYDPYEIV